MPEFKSDPNFVITPAIWRESEKILKRCYKMLEITEYERTAWVRKALAEAKPEVLAELTTPGSCKYTDPDAAIIVHDPEDDDNMGIDVEYLDCLRHGLSPEAYRLMRDYCLPATVVQRFFHLEPLRTVRRLTLPDQGNSSADTAQFGSKCVTGLVGLDK